MPTLLPQMMGLGNYFLQSSIGKLLNQLHNKRLDEQFETHRETQSPSTGDSEGTEVNEGKYSPIPSDPQGLDAVRRILETVNTSVTKQLLEANVRKLATSPKLIREAVDCHDQDSEMSGETSNWQDWQSGDQYDSQSEGLAAKLEDASQSSAKSRSGKRKAEEMAPESSIEADSEDDDDGASRAPGDSGRRVRARSLIDEEQLAVLKGYYQINQRPKKEEIVMIANYINFPTRVVQVWFQNSRARDRRESRIPALLPLSSIGNHGGFEQPLDLSKKEVVVVEKENHGMRSTLLPGELRESNGSVGVVGNGEDTEEAPLVIDEETRDSGDIKKQVINVTEVVVKVSIASDN